MAALWLLELALPGDPLKVGAGRGAGTKEGSRESLVAALGEIPLVATPILGTLAFLVLVLCLAETARWGVRRPTSVGGELRPAQTRVPEEPRTR